MHTVNNTVRGLLAHHLHRDPQTIHASHRLERDLDVTPLELVLIALDLEDIEHVEIPVEPLGDIATVGELVDFLSATVARQQRERLSLV